MNRGGNNMNIKKILSTAVLCLGVGFLSTAASAGSNTSLVLQMFGEGDPVGNLADVSKRVGIDLSQQDMGFALTDHSLNLYGKCSDCK